MAELVGTSEEYEYQHNATKNWKSNERNARKFKIRDTFWTDHVFVRQEYGYFRDVLRVLHQVE